MPRCVSKHANRLTTCCCSRPENCGPMPWWASDTRVPRWVVRVRLRKFYATARQSSFSPRSPTRRAAGESPERAISMPLRIQDYIASFREHLPFLDPMIEPWRITADVSRRIERFAATLDATAFRKSAGLLIHHEATVQTGVAKFGALIGDHSRVGANAVLSPGTVLAPHTLVARLELVNQGAAPLRHGLVAR